MSKTTVRGADGRLYVVSAQDVQLVEERAVELKPVTTLGKRADRTDEASAEYIFYP
jgi:hypothetical protein